MKQVYISDITLREPKTAQEPLSFKEKIEIAKVLDKLKVDTVELSEIKNEKTDTLLVRTIASLLSHSTLSLPVAADAAGIELGWNAVSAAKKPRLHLLIPVSPVQMEYHFHKKPAAVLDAIATLVAKAASLCGDVEISLLDATRSEGAFLRQAITKAIEAGATSITLCDSVGTMIPGDFTAFLTGLYNDVPALSDVNLGVEVTDELKMGTALAISAVLCGASTVKATANNKFYPSVEAIGNIIKLKGEDLGLNCSLVMTELLRGTAQIAKILETKKSEASPFESGVREATGIYLDKSDDIATVSKAVKALGYDLSVEDEGKVYEAFCRIACKKQVGSKDLDAIVANEAMQVPSTFKIVSYVVNCGNILTATAHIQLEKNGKVLSGISVGDGPVDASILAIEKIIGHHYELDDYQIQAVTEGREAMGSALVRLRSNGKLYSGTGISTDVIGASIRAYISALNKIVFEEE